jgi:hypothetical protein
MGYLFMTNTIVANTEMLVKLIQAQGYKAKPEILEKCGVIISATSGLNFRLNCYPVNNEEAMRLDSTLSVIQFYGGWGNLDDYNESELDALCNWFNLKYTFSKLYRTVADSESWLTIEAEIFLDGGFTTESFESRFFTFLNHFEDLKKHLDRCDRVSKADIVERHNRAIELIHGDQKDLEDAVQLYRTNSHLGFAGSQNNFGDLFEEGKGVPKDLLLATYWYSRAAERGEPTAYFSLSTILSDGNDNTEALVIAAKYAILAAVTLPEGKNKLGAIQVRDYLRERLGEELYEYASELARKFRPIYQEKWTMNDSPGPKVVAGPESQQLN